MNPIHVIAIVWMWHAFWMGLLTWSTGRAAYRHTGGWPVRRHTICVLYGQCKIRWFLWPVSGRWLLTALLLMITLMIIDIAVLSVRVLLSGDPTSLTWSNVILRALPIFIEPWVFWRQWKRGLVNDYPQEVLGRRKVKAMQSQSTSN